MFVINRFIIIPAHFKWHRTNCVWKLSFAWTGNRFFVCCAEHHRNNHNNNDGATATNATTADTKTTIDNETYKCSISWNINKKESTAEYIKHIPSLQYIWIRIGLHRILKGRESFVLSGRKCLMCNLLWSSVKCLLFQNLLVVVIKNIHHWNR